MRVLVIRNSSGHQDFGGAELFCKEIVNEYSSHGIDAKLVTGTKSVKEKCGDFISGPRDPVQNYSGVRYVFVPLFFVIGFFSFLRYCRIFKYHRPDAVHINSRDDFIFATIAAKRCKVPKIIWTDHAELKTITMNNQNLIKGIMGKKIAKASRYADHINTVSNNDKNIIKANTDNVISPVVIHNGFKDISHGISEQIEYDFVFATRLNKEKGIFETIDAFQSLQEKHVNKLKLLISADSSTPNFDNVVEYCNKIKGIDVESTYSDSSIAKGKIYVMPSYMEGASLALIKASCLSRAIISTNVGGIPEILEDGENALLIPPKDVAAAAKAMERLLSDVKLRRRLSVNARKNYEKNLNFSNIVKEKYLPLIS